jgi:integrase
MPNGDTKKMRILDEQEIQKLLFAASSDRWRALFSTLIFTGLRIGEALELTWDDIDTSANLITVRDSKTEAGKREVVMPEFVSKRLRRLRWENMGIGPGVFITETGTPLGKRNTLRALAGACVKAGIPHVTQHELRHTYASILIGRGFDATLVADQLGHKDPSITLRTYAKLFNPVERRAALREELDRAFGGTR